ncbi:MAG: 2OG-Fe(II) oxygenase family protein [Proteobacteria bacterium]|nr:2OG-Fe(II) oxygenase family protein [Pseudomonadota bacterium]
MSDDQVPDFNIRKSLSMVFATPLVVHDWPNSESHNAELQHLVLGKAADDAKNDITRSNAGGWQSAGNLITWKEPCIETLRQRIEKLVTKLLQELIRDEGRDRSFRLLIDSWANVSRRGDYNVVHTHPNCMWSGVYYVTPGKPDPDVPYGGLLELLDPREAHNYIQIANTVMDARNFYENKPGRMLLWPSWVKHMVHPYVGEGVRISIAFNVNVVEDGR